jgi:hypothetical protein
MQVTLSKLLSVLIISAIQGQDNHCSIVTFQTAGPFLQQIENPEN